MELNKKWHELAQRESVILNPSNEDKQEVYRLAFVDGAQTYADAVEKLLCKHIELCKNTARITPWNYTQTHEIINYKKKTYETLLTELKSIQP